MELVRSRMQIFLNKKNAYYLAGSCVSQLFIHTVNPGRVELWKYLMAGISFVWISRLLWNIWFKEDENVKKQLLIKIFKFVLIFQIAIFVISALVGELIALICGIVILSKLIIVME